MATRETEYPAASYKSICSDNRGTIQQWRVNTLRNDFHIINQLITGWFICPDHGTLPERWQDFNLLV